LLHDSLVLAIRLLDIGEDQRGEKSGLRILQLDGGVMHARDGRNEAQAQA